jgi:integrase
MPTKKRQQKRKDGTPGGTSYRARYRGPDGKERSMSFSRQVDADRWLVEQKAKVLARSWIDPADGKKPFEECAAEFMVSKVNLKPKTRASYDSLLKSRIIPTFGTMQIGQITVQHVDDWVAALHAEKLSPSRIRQAYNLVGAIFKRAVRLRYRLDSPCTCEELPTFATPPRTALNTDQVERLVEQFEEAQARLIVEVLAWTGIRIGEALALRRDDCLLDQRRLIVDESLAEVNGHLLFGDTKSHRSRKVVVPDSLADVLGDHLANNVGDDPEALLFTVDDGDPIRYSNFRRQFWVPAVNQACLGKLTMHELRHTYASIAASHGASVKMVQIQLGHADPALTLRLYQHLFPDDLDSLGTRMSEAREKAKIDTEENVARPNRGLRPYFDLGDNPSRPLNWAFVGAPGKIRTCAHGLGNRCSIP